MNTAPCKDCTGGDRPAPYQGPRCYTHWKEFRRAQEARGHARHIEATYGITAREYAALYDHQGGRCAICMRATGASRRLTVDHDHAGAAGWGERASVRGLLCRPCNDMLGHARDNADMFERARDYLINPPAWRVIDPDPTAGD